MELSYVLMEPYHRLLRKNVWTILDHEKAVKLNELEDLTWTQYYKGISLSVHLVAVELDYRIREKNYSELSVLREVDYAHVYQLFDRGDKQANHRRRMGWFYLCDTHALTHRLTQSSIQEDA